MFSWKTHSLIIMMLFAASCAAQYPAGVAVTGSLSDLDRAPICQVTTAIADEVVHEDDADHHDEVAHEDEAVYDDEAVHGDEVAHEDEAGHDEEAAIGPAAIEMSIEIEMSEFAYDCELPDIPVGTVVALRFINVGTIEHEAVVGDHTAQSTAAQEMAEMQSDDPMHGHGAPAITLQPGETVELIVAFDEPGEQIIGCHIPGHWDAGMNSYFMVTDA